MLCILPVPWFVSCKFCLPATKWSRDNLKAAGACGTHEFDLTQNLMFEKRIKMWQDMFAGHRKGYLGLQLVLRAFGHMLKIVRDGLQPLRPVWVSEAGWPII